MTIDHPDTYCRHGHTDYMNCEACQGLMMLGSYPLVGFLVEAGACAKWEHDLKIRPDYFRDVKEGRKTFEIRRNDRDFRPSDVLRLMEWDGQRFTGESLSKTVPYITEFEQKPGMVVMSLALWLPLRMARATK